MNEEERSKDIQRQFAEMYNENSMGGGLALEGLRLNPSMYLSSASAEGPRQAWIEILQNAIDEALALSAFFIKNGVTEVPKFIIDIFVYLDDTVTIADTGRGVPADISSKFKRPVLEVAFEENNVGGKGKNYVDHENSAYQNRGIGKHGSGGACTNATSDFFEVDSYVQKDDVHYKARWEVAKKVLPTTPMGSANGRHGTVITFRPSREVFELYSETRGEVDRYYDEEELISILEEYAFNTSNILYNFNFEQPDKNWRKRAIDADDYSRVKRLSEYATGQIYSATFDNEQLKFTLDVTLALTERNPATFLSCNKLKMRGGSHLKAVVDALDSLNSEVLKFINMFYEQQGVNKIILPSDISKLNVPTPSGFVSKDISIEMDFPEYTGQTKQELHVPRIKNQIEVTFKEMLNNELADFKIALLTEVALRYIKELDSAEALKEQQAAKAERDRKKKEKDALLGKGKGKSKNTVRGMGEKEKGMIYARNPNNKDVILYLVEGDTGVALMSKVRNVDNEAILPVVWSVPNVFDKTFETLAEMEQFKYLYRHLAGDGQGNGNYKSVVIATDPDAYGKQIRAKLIALICMYFPRYVEQGRLYVLNAPKYVGYSLSDTDKEKPIYFDTQDAFRDHRNNKDNQGQFTYSNYKGLGSMPVALLGKLMGDKRAVRKINPSTWQEDMEFLKIYLTDTKFKKQYIIEMYGDQSLIDHVGSRREILNLQEIEYNVNEIDTEFTSEVDLSQVRKLTSRETIIKEALESSGVDFGELVDNGWALTEEEETDSSGLFDTDDSDILEED